MASQQSKIQPRCPVCESPVERRAQNPTYPFCSARCRQIDLGRWLQEDYRIQVTPEMTERDLPEPPED